MLPHNTHLLGTVSLLIAAVAAATRPGAVWRAGMAALAAMAAAIAGGAVDALHDAADQALRSRGLYQGHAGVQWTMMAAAAVVVPVVGAAIVGRSRGAERAMLLALLALAALFLAQLVSLHAVDLVLGHRVGPVMAVALGWSAGAAAVVAAAIADARR